MILVPGMLDSRETRRFPRPPLVRAGHRTATMGIRDCGESLAERDDLQAARMGAPPTPAEGAHTDALLPPRPRARAHVSPAFSRRTAGRNSIG